MSRFLDAALALAAKGCRVFPMYPSSKRPRIRGWQRFATKNSTTIRRWADKWPDSNVGIYPEGLLVLDVDGPTGHERFHRLQKEFEIPETLRIESGNRAEDHHFQLLFWLPKGLRGTNKPLARFSGFEIFQKIDVRSERGQIVGPGSIHETGGVYRWAVEPSSVLSEAAEAPRWMQTALCRQSEAEVKESTSFDPFACELQAAIRRFHIGGPGERNNQTAKMIAFLVGKGIGRDVVDRVATAWVLHFQGVFRTPLKVAIEEARSLVQRTLENQRRGTFKLMPNHQRIAADQELTDSATSWLQELVCGRPANGKCLLADDQSTKHRVLCLGLRRLSTREEEFVEVLLLHCQQEFQTKGSTCSTVLATDRQWQAIFEHRHGRKLCNDTLYRAKRKFVTRLSATGKELKATGRELLSLVANGRLGEPSLYRLTGLSEAFQSL